ncbi:MAG TPA: trypsin-like peptidase domain-containing protein [Phycisphaerae bacterium]|nr:trypsin-like peptidase domain-containing protein [Phycisphaerae bacterium]HPS52275.1 trypsin-like peptidase domain-containing protein [Phycisphaerae bacterium]
MLKRCFIAAVGIFFAAIASAGTLPISGGVDFRTVVKSAKDKVFPAVVYIKCLMENMESGKKVTHEVAGSGVIISPKGEVLTNWHVVDKAVEIRCLLLDGRYFDADKIGQDKDTDLALLQLKYPKEKPQKFIYAELGDSAGMLEGDFVMAMGAPWGLNRSVTMGIIACTKRYLPDNSEYSYWFQTDAAISPGNSGGPLVDTDGKVIGINTRGIMVGGDTGFTIPSDTIKLIIARLREFGEANWSWTGLQLQPLKDFNKNIYFEGTQGVIVAETDPESPARRGGIKQRDRIIEINGTPVTAAWSEDLPEIRRLIGLLPKNKDAVFKVIRDGKTLDFKIKPRKKGKVEGEELECPRWDITVKAINQFDNPDLYFYCKQGVFVYGVKYPGNGSEAGLGQQDIILKIDGKSVKTLEDVRKINEQAIKDIDKNHRMIFTVLRNGLMQQIVVDYARDYEKE